eukprot:gene43990-25283_t
MDDTSPAAVPCSRVRELGDEFAVDLERAAVGDEVTGDGRGGNAAAPPPAAGAEADEVTVHLRRPDPSAGLGIQLAGTLVTGVDAGSAAAAAGVGQGMRVLRVAGERVIDAVRGAGAEFAVTLSTAAPPARAAPQGAAAPAAGPDRPSAP